MTPVPGRVIPAPRRLRFREDNPSLGDPPETEVVCPVEVNGINQHLEALHLGTPDQRRPNVSVEQVQSRRQLEFSVWGSRTTLEEFMKKDHEMKLLKKAKLKNTTVKGKVRELVCDGEQMKMSEESVDAQILVEFGLQGGRKLAKTLEGLIPTNREELEQEKDQPRRSERERKPYNRYKRESMPPPCPDYRSDQRLKKGEERAGRNDQKYQTRGGGRYRDQSRPRVKQNESTPRTGGYISPDKWEKMSTEERARTIAERDKSKTGTKIGQVRIESPQSNERRQLVEPKEVKIKRKRRNTEEPRA